MKLNKKIILKIINIYFEINENLFKKFNLKLKLLN